VKKENGLRLTEAFKKLKKPVSSNKSRRTPEQYGAGENRQAFSFPGDREEFEAIMDLAGEKK
jgi:hypothetical protein